MLPNFFPVVTIHLYMFYHTRFTCFVCFHTGWSNKYWSRRKNVWNIWYVSYHKIYFNKMPHLMQFSKLHVNHACYSVCCWITIAQNVQEIPWASQQKLPHNRFWEKQSFDRLLFLCLFGLFSTLCECICDRFYYRQCCHSCAEIL